jgi:hypothetical protein
VDVALFNRACLVGSQAPLEEEEEEEERREDRDTL